MFSFIYPWRMRILLTSKHFIKILIALELILLSVNLLIILFSAMMGELEGQLIFIIILTIEQLKPL